MGGRSTKRNRWIVIVLCLVVVAATSCVERLGALPGDTRSVGTAINDDGTIVGSSKVGTSGSHAFRARRYHDPEALALPPDHTYSEGRAINAGGTAAGQSCTPAFDHCRAVTWSPDNTVTVLPEFARSEDAEDVNTAGVVVGTTYHGSGDPPVDGFPAESNARPYVWSPGDAQLTLLPVPSACHDGWAYAVNDAGQATGYLNGCDDHTFHVVRWDVNAKTVVDLGPGYGRDINASGVIAGSYYNIAAIWEPGHADPTLLGELLQDSQGGMGINDAGVVVGYQQDLPNPDSQIFRWTAATGIEIVRTPRQHAVSGINNHGVLVGSSPTSAVRIS